MMTAYDEWIAMYTPELESLADNPMRRLSMILLVYDQQVAEIRSHLEDTFRSLEPSYLGPASKENSQNSLNSTLFIKPLDKKRLPKSNVSSKRLSRNFTLKESPDMFSHSPDMNLNNNIASFAENDNIPSSPENSSPRIKRKRHLHRNKVQNIKKSSQSMVNMPKGISMYNCQTSTYPAGKKQSFNAGTQVVDDDDDEDKEEEDSDDSMMNIDDILNNVDKSAEEEQDHSEKPEICRSHKPEVKLAPNCFQCKGLGTPCSRHREPPILRQPDKTFEGFWNLDFTDPKSD